MPIMVDAELWRESGRIDAYGKELVRFDDRHGREFVLGPTHEETVTALVRNELRSYKQLPVNLYHIQDKFRDEFRPRFWPDARPRVHHEGRLQLLCHAGESAGGVRQDEAGLR